MCGEFERSGPSFDTSLMHNLDRTRPELLKLEPGMDDVGGGLDQLRTMSAEARLEYHRPEPSVVDVYCSRSASSCDDELGFAPEHSRSAYLSRHAHATDSSHASVRARDDGGGMPYASRR